MSSQPFDDIRALVGQPSAPTAVTPAWAIGRLGPTAEWIAAWRGEAAVNRPILALYAGTHQGAGGALDTRARLEAIAAGEAPVARAVQHLGAGLDVFDLAIDRPVPDIAVGAAMRERECAATMAFGMEALAKQPDLLILAGFGAGADEAAEALLLALLGEAAVAAPTARASAAAARALAEAGDDPLQLLRQLGGRETAALAGAIVAARAQRTPVLLEGAPALAAAAALAMLEPSAIAHCRAARPSAAAGALGMERIADLELGLDDGAGALAALGLIRLACALARPAAN
jgi:nicotinate-nucleotide--dimethylbenzimidazole phosphoribosyltransferase